MLNRDTEERVLKLCATQRNAFALERWLHETDVAEPDLAVVALYLAGGDWYGHQADLELVAEKLRPGCVGHFAELVRETRFECSRFGNMLKVEMGMK